MNVHAQPFRNAVTSIGAVLSSFGLVYCLCRALDANASPAILAATLAVGLSRRMEVPNLRALSAEFAMLPLIALAAGFVGTILLQRPPLGAVLFTAGIALSILMRKYGRIARTLGRAIAIPLVSILVVPVRIEGIPGKWLPIALMASAGLSAMVCSVVAARISRHAGWGGIEIGEPSRAPDAPTPATRPLHIAERMALQMLVALALAFGFGMTFFPAHWAWVVLTAFIVCSGAISRGDAVYKGLLRLGGAIGGAFLAAGMAHVSLPDPAASATVIFAVLFIGIWLRQINYGYWAVCATLIFALLQGTHDEAIVFLLGIRITCIFIGALCGIAAVCLVYPVRSEQLVRKRVAEALHALRDMLASRQAPDFVLLEHHAAELEHIAAPVRLHRRLLGSSGPMHPATWVDRMQALIAQARSSEPDRALLGEQMRELGAMLKARPEGVPRQGSDRRIPPFD